MQGKILDYNNDMKSGLIRGNDGNKYRFSIDDCKSSVKPHIGAEVDFETNGDKATDIYVLTSSISSNVQEGINSTATTAKKILPTIIIIIVVGIILLFLEDMIFGFGHESANTEMTTNY